MTDDMLTIEELHRFASVVLAGKGIRHVALFQAIYEDSPSEKIKKDILAGFASAAAGLPFPVVFPYQTEATGLIALDEDSVLFAHLKERPPIIEGVSRYESTAELKIDDKDHARLRISYGSAETQGRYMDLTISNGYVPGNIDAVRALAEAINSGGRIEQSKNPVTRFVARSLKAQAEEAYPYLLGIYSASYLKRIRNKPIERATDQFLQDEDWKKFLEKSNAAHPFDEDEIMVFALPASKLVSGFMLTNKRYYFANADKSISAYALGEIRDYGMKEGWWKSTLTLTLTNGEVIRSKGDFMRADKFHQYVEGIRASS